MLVDEGVVVSAQGHEVTQLGLTAVGPVLDVVTPGESAVGTTRKAAGLIAAAERSLDRRRDRALFYEVRDARFNPLRRRVLDELQRHVNAMDTSVFALLQAKQAVLDAGRLYLDALHDYWLAYTALEWAVGDTLPTRRTR